MSLHLVLLVTTLSCLSFQASATTIDEQIYKALAVKEVNKVPKGVLGSIELEKKAGSLTCTKKSVVYPNAIPDYQCALGAGSDNVLFDALKVPEVDVTPEGMMGSRQTEKRIGDDFSCRRIEVVGPKSVPTTTCGFIMKARPAQRSDSSSGAEATH